MSDLSKTPILFTPPEVRYKHLLPNVTNPAFFAGSFYPVLGRGVKCQMAGWWASIRALSWPWPLQLEHICPTSTTEPSIYLMPYIPDKAPQRPETDLCNKRFIVNLVLFVIGLHQLACRRPISLWVGNIIGIKLDVYALPLAISNETPHIQVFTTQFVYLHP